MSFILRHREKNKEISVFLNLFFLLFLIMSSVLIQLSYPIGWFIFFICLALFVIIYVYPMIGIYTFILLYPLESIFFKITTVQPYKICIYFEEIFLLLLLFVMILRELNDRHKNPNNRSTYFQYFLKRINFFIALFLCWSIFTIFRSPHIIHALYDFYKFIGNLIIIAFLVRYVDNYHRLVHTAICVCCVAVIYSLSAVYATHWAFEYNLPLLKTSYFNLSLYISLFNQSAGFLAEVVGLIVGVGFSAKHELTLFLSSAILFTFYLFEVYNSVKIRITLLVLLLLYMTVIYQAFSRLSMVGLMFVLVFLCISNPSWKKYFIRILISFIILNVSGLLFSSMIRTEHMKNTESTQQKIKSVESKSKFAPSSLAIRFYIWEKSINRILQNNGLGTGPGSLTRDIAFGFPHSHNLALTLMAEYGIPGAAIIGILLFIIGVQTFRSVLIQPQKSYNFLLLQIILIGIIFHALFEYFFDVDIHSRHLWFNLGLLIATLSIENQVSPPEDVVRQRLLERVAVNRKTSKICF